MTLADLLDREDRACRNRDWGMFFPPPGGLGTLVGERAKAVCSRCPIRRKCLDYALERPLLDGVWGGATADERVLMRKHPEMAS